MTKEEKLKDLVMVIKTITIVLSAIASLMIVSFAWAGILHLMGYGR
jgi:hypothetical protein